jgi:hypothetical protein
MLLESFVANKELLRLINQLFVMKILQRSLFTEHQVKARLMSFKEQY